MVFNWCHRLFIDLRLLNWTAKQRDSTAGKVVPRDLREHRQSTRDRSFDVARIGLGIPALFWQELLCRITQLDVGICPIERPELGQGTAASFRVIRGWHFVIGVKCKTLWIFAPIKQVCDLSSR